MSRALSRLCGRIAVALTLSAAASAVAGPASAADADLIAPWQIPRHGVRLRGLPHRARRRGRWPAASRFRPPSASIMSTNITPSKENGIGNYTLEQFDAAVRKGVRADGKHLYPAMPYTAYVLLSDDDVAALYAYFMNGVDAGRNPPCRNEAAVPVQHPPVDGGLEPAVPRQRPLQAGLRRMTPNGTAAPIWCAGRRIAAPATRRATCSWRNGHLSEMAGGDVGPWHAPNITSDANSGIGGWSVEELVAYMRDGHVAAKVRRPARWPKRSTTAFAS